MRQKSADGRTDGKADGGGRGKNTEREAENLRRHELDADNRGTGDNHRSPEALDQTGDNQHGKGYGKSADKGCRGEDGKAGNQNLFYLSAGGDISEDEDCSGYHEEVDDDRPGDRAGICSELRGNQRKGDIYDRAVEPVHEGGKRDGYEEEKGLSGNP